MADSGVGHIDGVPGPVDVLPLADGTGVPWDVPVDYALRSTGSSAG